ncbi:MAG: hypothetical protein WCF53_05835, partial [Pseudolabrys sp.]
TAVVRAFVPLIAGILGMSPRQFYAANILSALVWAPAHIFPGVQVAMALRLTGAAHNCLNRSVDCCDLHYFCHTLVLQGQVIARSNDTVSDVH